MNKEQAKAWLPLIQAVAEGKTLQYKSMIQSTLEPVWCDIKRDDLLALWSHDCLKVRIKPEPKKAWYRVALFKGDVSGVFTATVDSTQTNQSKTKEDHPCFVRWLTDQVEYELPEGEA